MLATVGQLGEFLIGTSNQSEILRENVGIQFHSLRQINYPTASSSIHLNQKLSWIQPNMSSNGVAERPKGVVGIRRICWYICGHTNSYLAEIPTCP
jgi:hypothetical protein